MRKFVANALTPNQHDYRLWERKNAWLRRSGMEIGSNVAIDRGFDCLHGEEEGIEINDYSAIGVNCHIWNFNKVHIGKFCMFAADVTLTNGGHDPTSFEPFSGPLSVGNGVWVGTGAKIAGPVTIGDNSIIGAGSVVVRDIPPNSIAVGIPCRVVRQRDVPSSVWHLGNDYFSPVTFEIVKK